MRNHWYKKMLDLEFALTIIITACKQMKGEKLMKIVYIIAICAIVAAVAVGLRMCNSWDKTFAKNDAATVKTVHVTNRYGIKLTGDLYTPKNMTGTALPAIAVSGPFGAVKEQVSGRYAQEMAARGFVALAFDASYTGQSGGKPRNVASPDINTEDFSAAVDYLTTLPYVNPDKIGIIGICGFGGMGLNAAAMDTRIKAVVTSTMYDMSRVNARGYYDVMDADARYAERERLNAQRTIDAKNGDFAFAGGLPAVAPDDALQFMKDYVSFYKTPRGYHKRSVASNDGWRVTSALSFMNMPILAYSDEIRSPVLMIHGENAHSRYFSEDAFKRLRGDNKELMIIPGANHVDLYDNMDKIPFDKIESFFETNLK